MRIDWIRHGIVAGNLEKRYVGSTDEGLTEEGIRAAREKKPDQPDHVFVSPRLRCIETARLLYPDCGMTVIEDLAECDFGRFEYKNYMELSGDPDYQRWIDSGGLIGFPGGEDRETFIRRCLRGFYQAVEQAEGSHMTHIAFVVHGGTIMAVMDQLSRPHRDYFNWQCRNLEGYKCTYIDGFMSDTKIMH